MHPPPHRTQSPLFQGQSHPHSPSAELWGCKTAAGCLPKHSTHKSTLRIIYCTKRLVQNYKVAPCATTPQRCRQKPQHKARTTAAKQLNKVTHPKLHPTHRYKYRQKRRSTWVPAGGGGHSAHPCPEKRFFRLQQPKQRNFKPRLYSLRASDKT